jgi:uncharacterized peroxidase-related enzyme
MIRFDIHTIDSAPAETREHLQAARDRFGFLPNLLAELAGAPAALDAYLTLNRLLSETSLSPQEQQVVLAAASVANRCDYCVAAHTAGLKMSGTAADDIEALRAGGHMNDPRLESVRALATDIVEQRGWPREAVVKRFLEAGHRKEQILEVLVGVAMKTLSNSTNHLAGTPLDQELSQFAWETAEVS